MFFPPATHGLVSVESGDLMASEIVPVPCECWRVISFWNLEDEAACKTGWSGLVPKGDATVICCKWFAPRNRRDDSDVHARAFAASSTCASLPVAPHVPVAHTFARQLVQGNQGEWLDVDYILIDFVGPSMMSWLMTVNHRWTGALLSFVATSFRLMYSILMYVIRSWCMSISNTSIWTTWRRSLCLSFNQFRLQLSQMLQKSFLSLMLLCHRSHLSNLSWDQELLSGSLCYDVVKRRWFWDDAATLDEQTVQISCARACHRAARLLMHELQAYMYAKADAHSVFVQWQAWLRIHLGETKGSNIDVAGIAVNLGLDHPEPPWHNGRLDFHR